VGPEAYADRPIFTFETGGSTGVPKSRIAVEDSHIDYEMFSDTLPDEYFPRGAEWIPSDRPARAVVAWPWSTSRNTSAASASWWISTRVG
jgi:hypothetical protein